MVVHNTARFLLGDLFICIYLFIKICFVHLSVVLNKQNNIKGFKVLVSGFSFRFCFLTRILLSIIICSLGKARWIYLDIGHFHWNIYWEVKVISLPIFYLFVWFQFSVSEYSLVMSLRFAQSWDGKPRKSKIREGKCKRGVCGRSGGFPSIFISFLFPPLGQIDFGDPEVFCSSQLGLHFLFIMV